MELSVSILNAKDKKETIKILNNTNISYIHMDVMDGMFVSQKTIPVEELKSLAGGSKKKLDVHLMMNGPTSYIEEIKNIPNIEYITIHEEIDNVKEILSKIKSYGFKAGLSIKPNTTSSAILPYLEDIDLVLIMTVEPGYGGQSLIEATINKISEVRNIINNRNIKIEVDGGINKDTINLVNKADIAVIGSYITGSDNIPERIDSLLV